MHSSQSETRSRVTQSKGGIGARPDLGQRDFNHAFRSDPVDTNQIPHYGKQKENLGKNFARSVMFVATSALLQCKSRCSERKNALRAPDRTLQHYLR